MTLTIAPGLPSDSCHRCGEMVAPVVSLFDPQTGNQGTHVCILCLAGAVDAVTGWRWQAMMVHSLVISDASERFRNPLYAATKPARQPKPKVYRSRRKQDEALAAGESKLGLIGEEEKP